jgi:hypothetical protein
MHLKRRLAIFWSKGFIFGLVLLLVNDHILKSSFHNVITGKLSDLAGLFIFPMFFAAFFPKYKIHIYFITAVGFIFWKSPWSNGIIESWNQWGIFTIARVVDYTDLLAILILPLSYWYANQFKPRKIQLDPVPLIILSSFAFIATSKGPERITVNYRHTFDFPLDTLKSRLFFNDQIKILDNNDYREKWKNLHSLEQNSIDSIAKLYSKEKKDLIFNTVKNELWIFLPDTFCNNQGFEMKTTLTAIDKPEKSSIFIGEVTYYCSEQKKDVQQRLAEIEKRIIKSLKK